MRSCGWTIYCVSNFITALYIANPIGILLVSQFDPVNWNAIVSPCTFPNGYSDGMKKNLLNGPSTIDTVQHTIYMHAHTHGHMFIHHIGNMANEIIIVK